MYIYISICQFVFCEKSGYFECFKVYFSNIAYKKGNFVLKLEHISVTTDTHCVVKDLSFEIQSGSLVLLQGSNGSGKSSLCNALAGHPLYDLTGKVYTYNTIDFLKNSVVDKALAGLFLVSQHPPILPGISFSLFLKESFRALYLNADMKMYDERLSYALSFLSIDPDFMEKNIHESMSGGEKKRSELIQLMVLQPTLVILDEIDSGLDMHGIELFLQVIAWYQQTVPEAIIIVVTHSEYISQELYPDKIYNMVEGSLHERP